MAKDGVPEFFDDGDEELSGMYQVPTKSRVSL